MFGKFFGEKTEGEKEINLAMHASVEFDEGVNSSAVHAAFQKLKRLNSEKGLGLTNNHLLNLVAESARGSLSAMDIQLLGGREAAERNINSEIEKLRRQLTDEEKGS